jgi:hypothetical protein
MMAMGNTLHMPSIYSINGARVAPLLAHKLMLI